MKIFVKITCIVALCVALCLCSSACDGSGNETESQNDYSYYPYYYQYQDIQPPPKIEIPEIPDYSLDFDQILGGNNDNSTSKWDSDSVFVITYYTSLSYNNSVGNEWGYGVKYNGKYVESGSRVAVSGNLLVDITAYAVEFDSYNDYGSKTVSFKPLSIGEKNSKEVTVTVRENNGRYTGNTAQWVFEITVERIS